MFTIRDIFLIGSQIILHDAVGRPNAAPAFVPSDAVRLQDLWEKSKGLFKGKEREAFLTELRKVTKENKENHENLVKDIDLAITTASVTGNLDEVKKLTEFKKAVEAEYAEATRNLEAKKQATRLDAMNKRGGLKEGVDTKDNNIRQAEALIKGLEGVKDNAGVAALLQAVKEGVEDSSNIGAGEVGISTKRKLDLTDLNIRGLVDYMMSGKKDAYRSNGAFGPFERWTLDQVVKIYEANKEALTPVFKEVARFYDAGQTTEDWLLARSKEKLVLTPGEGFKANFVKYLSEYREGTVSTVNFDAKGRGKLETQDRSFFTPYAPGELQNYFSKMDDATLVTRLKDIVKLGGEEIKGDTPTALSDAMMKTPILRAAYIKGLNYIAMSENRANYFRTGKLDIGVTAEKAKGLVDYFKDKKNLDEVKKGVTKAADAHKVAVAANESLTSDQKKNILAGIDTYTATLNDDEKLRQVALDASITLTNKGVAFGAGVGRSVESALADSVSLGGAIVSDFQGQLGAALALAFTKELYHSTKADFGLHYGLFAGKGGVQPFAGIHGSYDDFLASVTKSPIGVNVFLGMRLGKGTDTVRDLEGLSSAQKEIFQLAGRSRGSDVSLASLVSNPAIATRMDAELRTLLERNDYNKTATQEENYAVLYPAIIEVMNMEIIRLRRESNDTGWSMKEIGVNFGKISGLAYVLPGFRMGRDDLQVSYTRGKETIHTERTFKDKAEITAILKQAGFELSESFDATKGEKKFVISGETSKKAPPLVKIPEVAGNTIRYDQVNDVGTITAKTNIELKVDQKADGKITITIVDKGAFAVVPGSDAPAKTEQIAGIDLARDTGFEAVMNTVEARRVLSRAIFWGRSELDAFLTAYHKADMSDATKFLNGVVPSLNALLRKNQGNKVVKSIMESLAKSAPADALAKIVRLRTAFMTDASNTEGMKDLENFQVKEGVKKNWESRKASSALETLASSNGVNLDDFDSLMSSDAKTYKAVTGKVGDVDTSKLIGVVAGYKGKSEAHGFSVMPRGMMSIAVVEGKPLIEVENNDANKKIALEILKKYQPNYYATMVENTKNAVAKISQIDKAKISDTQVIDLLVGKSVTIDGKEIKTKGTQYYRAAFGECLNTPTWAFSLGEISYQGKTTKLQDGSSLSGSTVDVSEGVTYRTSVGTDSIRVGLAGGTLRDPNNPATSTPGQPDPTPPGGATSTPGQGVATQGNGLNGGVAGNPSSSGSSLGSTLTGTVTSGRGGSPVTGASPATGVANGGVSAPSVGPNATPATVRGTPAPQIDVTQLAPIQAIDSTKRAGDNAEY